MSRPPGRTYPVRPAAGRSFHHQRIGARATLAQIGGWLAEPRIRGIAPLSAVHPVWDWRICGCDYTPPIVKGRPAPRSSDPAHAGWTEESNRSGAQVLSAVLRTLAIHVYGLGWFHSRDSIREHPGHPDLHLWGPGGYLVREVKTMTGEFYVQQWAHLSSMRIAGLDVGTYRSCCLLSGRVDAEFAALAGCAPKGEYARAGARPAVSGIVPGPPVTSDSLAAMPAPTPRRTAGRNLTLVPPPPAAAVLEQIGGGGATGYLIRAGGLVDAADSEDLATVRAWLRSRGIATMALTNPMRLILADNLVHVHVRSPIGAEPRVAWVPVAGEGIPMQALDTLVQRRGSVVCHTRVEAVKWLIESHAGEA